MESQRVEQDGRPQSDSITGLEWLGLLTAMTFPAVLTWFYFVALGGGGQINPLQQMAYSGGKVIQFTFPLVFLWLRDRRLPRPGLPQFTGLGQGLVFGLVVLAAMLGIYFGYYRGSVAFAQSSVQVQHKLQEFGLTSPGGYLGLAVFVVIVHSLLEEYYWRWFVFRELRKGLALTVALLLSSVAFMAHHVIVLQYYFPGHFLTAVVPFSLGVAFGGLVWGWLFERTRSIYACWLSHLLVDAGIFIIGWDLLQRAGS
jgi:membrane protease YdiL (CAAX protease family)